AVNIRNLIQSTTGVEDTIHTSEATIIQSRHRIPEVPLKPFQILVLQVPTPEPLRSDEPSERKTKILHGDKEYSGAHIKLLEQIIRIVQITADAACPLLVTGT